MTDKQKEVVELLSMPLVEDISNPKHFGRETVHKEKVKKLCITMEDMCNSVDFHPEEITEKLMSDCLSRSMFSYISLLWIETLANTQYYDERNSYSVQTAKELFAFEKLADYIEFFGKDSDGVSFDNISNATKIFDKVENTECALSVIVCEYMKRAHRTIQQTFSSLCFYYLHSISPRFSSIKDVFVEYEKEHIEFWRTPFI